MKWKPTRFDVPAGKDLEHGFVPVVRVGAFATGAVGDGKLIPLAILDTTSRPDIAELIRVHEYVPPGDATSTWARRKNDDETISLVLNFTKPSPVAAILEFDILRLGGFVDQIVHSKLLCIQAGRPGDVLVGKMDEPKVLLEIPDTGFAKVWDRVLREKLMRDYRRKGLSKSEARKAVDAFVREWRSFTAFRMSAQ